MTSKYCSRRCERVAFRKRESEKKKNEKESAEALREEEKIKSLREIESFVIQAIPIYSLTNLLVSHEPFLPLESYSTWAFFISLFIKNPNSLEKVNHIYAVYRHLKLKIDKIFLNAINTQFWGKNTKYLDINWCINHFFERKASFFQFYYDISDKNTTFAYIET